MYIFLTICYTNKTMSTKEKVLKILTNCNNEIIDNLYVSSSINENTISGETLAKECGVSRTAIWKAINNLRKEGFQIEGTTNGGYLLKNDKDGFDKELFTKYFSETFPAFKDSHIECFEEIDSTNTYGKKLLAENGSFRQQNGQLTEFGKKYHNSIIVAESQTAGRGRLGRTFYSPKKTGIYLSIIYSPEGGITQPAKLTAFSAVAVYRAIKKLYNVEPAIKWINDIFINGKKVCGILTEGFTNFETGTIEAAIIGIGVNIHDNPECFPKDVAKIAGGILGADDGSPANNKKDQGGRCQLAALIAGEVLSVLEEDTKSVMEEYKRLSFIIGQEVEIHPVIGNDRENYVARVVDIDENASLVVQLPDGTKRTLSSGEISLKSSSFIA